MNAATNYQQMMDSLLLSARTQSLQHSASTREDAIAWLEKYCYVALDDGGGMRPIQLAPHQKRILSDISTRDENGRFPYITVLYSAPKKSGKTAIASAFCQYFMWNEPGPTEIYILANDQEQAQGRIFRSIWQSMWANPMMNSLVHGKSMPGKGNDMIVLPHGTFVQALPNDYAGAAGSNHSLTLYSELWGYRSEESRKLWDELTPVPTRRNSMRFVETYAGFKGESQILEELYNKFVREEFRVYKDGFELDGVEYPPLPVYIDPESRTYIYWDTEPRMSWQTPEYYAAEAKILRPSSFQRLHKNEWASSETLFVSEEMWNQCEKPLNDPIWQLAKGAKTYACDASTKLDHSGIVGGTYNKDHDLYFVTNEYIWEPEFDTEVGENIVDLEETMIARLLLDNPDLTVYDPHQLHSAMTTLRKRKKMKVKEFVQNNLRTQADGHLYEIISQGKLVVPPNTRLRNYVLRAQMKELNEGARRLTKGKRGVNKIDLAVALSMMCFAAKEWAGLWKKIKFAKMGEITPRDNTESGSEKSSDRNDSTDSKRRGDATTFLRRLSPNQRFGPHR